MNKHFRPVAAIMALCMAFSLFGCAAPATELQTEAAVAPTAAPAETPMVPDESVPAPAEPAPTASAAPAEEANNGIIPGTYCSVQDGYRGHVKVYVTVDETSILDVTVAECTDLPDHLTAVPIALLPAAIMENQSTEVDTVSGATFTSLGILTAVKDCLAQANAGDLFTVALPKAPAKTVGEDIYTDVLVIGGGGSGCVAALSAKYQNLDSKDSGLSVTVVEKQSWLGGSTALSGGGGITSYYTDDEEILNASYEFAYNLIFPRNELGKVNEALLHNLVETSGETLIRLNRIGMPIDVNNLLTFNPAKPMISVRPLYKEGSFYLGLDYFVGRLYGDFFANRFVTSGIDLRLNTTGTELIVDDGAVIGAKVEGPDSYYNIYAKKVILSTGGLVQDREMIEKYAPQDINCMVFANKGNTGDGFKMAEAVDAAVIGDRLLAYMGADARFGMWPKYGLGFLWGTGIAVHVDLEGKRFANEIGYDSNIYYRHLLSLPNQTAYMIIDSANPNAYQLEDALLCENQDYLIAKADSIEELAEQIGVPADTLAKTIQTYNSNYDNGVTDEFGTPADKMLPVRTPPFYAMILRPVAIGSLVGFDMTGDCEVKNTAGEVIPNLYATGEMALGGNLMTIYTGSYGVGVALHSGRIAGEHAKAAVLAESAS